MLPLLTPEMMVVGTSDDTEELVELPFKLDVAVLFATDEGVTPFLVTCKTPDCGRRAHSLCYSEQCQVFEATHEWFRPSLADMAYESASMRDHVERGGLVLRRIK